jgi:hypothetical protein
VNTQDEGIVIHASRISIQKRTPMKRPMSRPNTTTKTPSAIADALKDVPINPNSEEMKKLRFSRHVSAFDVDIDQLEEHPWRNKNVDILDYFNYGFNETTWKVSYEISISFLYFYLIITRLDLL